jgi:hypothetical protein
MWTKRNNHASKHECVDSFNICPKEAVFKKNKKIKVDHFLVFSCLGLLFPPKKYSLENLL